MLEGAQVADLPASDQLRGTPIVVTDRRGDAWTTTLTAVVSRSDTEIVVTKYRPAAPVRPHGRADRGGEWDGRLDANAHEVG